MTEQAMQWSDEEYRELRKVFFAQTREIIADLRDLVMSLETEPSNDEVLKTVKRNVHTLKGDSNAMGLTFVGALCHRMEDALSHALTTGGIDHEAADLLLAAVDTIERLVASSEAGGEEAGGEDMLARIDCYLDIHCSGGRSTAPAETAALTEYELLQVANARSAGQTVFDAEVRFHPRCAERGVAARMLAARVAAIGQLIRSFPAVENPGIEQAAAIRLVIAATREAAAIEQALSLTGISESVRVGLLGEEAQTISRPAAGTPLPASAAAQNDMVRIEASRVDRIMDLVGELIIGRSMMEQATRELEDGLAASDAAARFYSINTYLERTVGDLQKAVMKMRMVPINHVFRKFPKMVRDLAAEKGKQLRLEVKGRETELDKGIVDALGEPLAHIIRNLIDHGIELPGERSVLGKPEEGVIALRAFHEGSQFVIEASDDGRGIDAPAVKKKALEKGFIDAAAAAAMNETDAMNLIFLSGLSTAAVLSGTSGRGVGMDAVKSAVESLKGSIEIESEIGKGTLFRLRLPLTLAVIKALLFQVGERLYALPVSVISEVAKVMGRDLTTVDGRKTLLLRDQVISMVDIKDLFHVAGTEGERKYALIIGSGSRRMGLLIDKLMWQQELVIKAVDEDMVSSPCVAGASILGNGKVVLILDEQAMLRKAIDDEKRRLAAA
ncbi:MAG: chemotaxis protein CheA [Nitrospirota bacterium]|nr:chemotaxis protein CheA [Nitrospirota bacterium]